MFFLLRLRHHGAESLRVFERRPLIAKARVGDFVVRDDVNFSELTLCQIEFHEKQRRLVSQKKRVSRFRLFAEWLRSPGRVLPILIDTGIGPPPVRALRGSSHAQETQPPRWTM